MTRFWTILAVLTACVAVGYFAVISRNEFVWMAADLPVGATLPIDDLQIAKERLSVGLLVLSLALFGAVALVRRTKSTITGAVCGAAIVSGAWYALFWSM